MKGPTRYQPTTDDNAAETLRPAIDHLLPPKWQEFAPPFFTKIRTRFYWDHVINGANMGTPASPFFGPTVAHFLPPVTTAPHPLQGTMRCAIRFLGQKCGRRWPDR